MSNESNLPSDYVKPQVPIDMDGNAFMVIGVCSRALRKSGHGDLVEQYQDEATSGDYNQVLRASMKYCEFV